MVNEFDNSRYVTLVRQEWSEQAPSVVAQMPDAQQFFTSVGEQVSARVARMCEQMSPQVPADLPYLQRVAQLKAIRKQAEELVLQDLLFEPIAQSQETNGANPGEQLEGAQAQAPHPRDLERDLVDLRYEAQQMSQDEGLEQTSYDPHQQQRLDWMLKVRPLIGLDPSTMSASAANEAATQLRTLLADRP